MLAQSRRSRVFFSIFESKVGELWIASTDAAIVRLSFPGDAESTRLDWVSRHFPGRELVPGERENAQFHSELDEYFRGARRAFECRVRLSVSQFSRRVLKETAKIPYGDTSSYGEIARALGMPAAARAVGRALAANPVAIIIPCHRVVGKDGSLVGFGGGLAIKERLLSHERAQVRLMEQGGDSGSGHR